MQNKDPVAIILPNYNMPEAADAIGNYIETYIKYPHKLIVIDNGSDITPPSKWTSLLLNENLQTTVGWLIGLNYADYLEIKHKAKFFAYWVLITSTSFPDTKTDLLSPLVQFLKDNPDAASISHSLTNESTSGWKHLYDRGTNAPRRTWMLDNISTLYRADWFNSIKRFDPKMIYAWGSDLETSYLARSQNKSLWVYDGLNVTKKSDIAYQMKRMGMSSGERHRRATDNMIEVLESKYGNNWKDTIYDKYIDPSWR